MRNPCDQDEIRFAKRGGGLERADPVEDGVLTREEASGSNESECGRLDQCPVDWKSEVAHPQITLAPGVRRMSEPGG